MLSLASDDLEFTPKSTSTPNEAWLNDVSDESDTGLSKSIRESSLFSGLETDDSKNRVDADGPNEASGTSIFDWEDAELLIIDDVEDGGDPKSFWFKIFLNLFSVNWLEWPVLFDKSSMLILELKLLIDIKFGCGLDFFLVKYFFFNIKNSQCPKFKNKKLPGQFGTFFKYYTVTEITSCWDNSLTYAT